VTSLPILAVGFLLELSVRAAVLLAAAGLATRLLTRAAAAARHLVWATAVIAVLVLPLVPSVLPAGWLPALVIPSRESSTVVPNEATAGAVAPGPEGLPPSWQTGPERPLRLLPLLALAVWGSGSLALAGLLAMASFRLRRRIAAATPVDERVWRDSLLWAVARAGAGATIRLRCCSDAISPILHGTRDPVLLLPADADRWPEARKRQVLVHELAHVRRRDVLLQWLAELVRVIHWPNPLAWLPARRMRIERELACDDEVLGSGVKASDYAMHLLDVARAFRWRAQTGRIGVAMANEPWVERRIRALLDSRSSRRLPGPRGLVLLFGIAAAGTFLLGALDPHDPGARPGGSTSVASATRVTSGPELPAWLIEANGRYLQAVTGGDACAVSELYTADAVSRGGDGEYLRGRTAIREYWEGIFALGLGRPTVRILSCVERGDRAYETGDFTLRWLGIIELPTWRYQAVWVRENGQWRIDKETGSF
jgi:beta-lactamase regulating signal transducer with metallopeptidase domain/ketosteroid isomerase-like protein